MEKGRTIVEVRPFASDAVGLHYGHKIQLDSDRTPVVLGRGKRRAAAEFLGLNLSMRFETQDKSN